MKDEVSDAANFGEARLDNVARRIRDHAVARNRRDAWGVLTDAEIIAVLSWIKAQWPAHIRAEQEKVNKQYAESRGQR